MRALVRPLSQLSYNSNYSKVSQNLKPFISFRKPYSTEDDKNWAAHFGESRVFQTRPSRMGCWFFRLVYWTDEGAFSRRGRWTPSGFGFGARCKQSILLEGFGERRDVIKSTRRIQRFTLEKLAKDYRIMRQRGLVILLLTEDEEKEEKKLGHPLDDSVEFLLDECPEFFISFDREFRVASLPYKPDEMLYQRAS